VPLLGGIDIYDTFGWAMLTRLVPWLLVFLMFQSLYRWVPRTEVKWSEAFWGALFAATAWEIGKSIFGWFLSSGLASYQLVYGSLGAVVALMLWIYLSSVITLLGAHLSAAITFHNRPKRKRRSRRGTT
jgi:membrane protein